MKRRGGWTRQTSLAATAMLVVAVMAAPTAEAKKKSKNKAAEVSATVGQAIPQPADSVILGPIATAPPTLKSGLVVGKKFKGKTVGRVSVTLKTTGFSPDAGGELAFQLSAPDGTTIPVQQFPLYTQSIGPVTFVPNSPVQPCSSPRVFPDKPACDPGSLNAPFAGTIGSPGLRLLSGLSMRGTWTLRSYDVFGGVGNQPSTLDSWGLRIEPAKTASSKKK